MAITSHILLKSPGNGQASGKDPGAVSYGFEVSYQLKSNDPLDGKKTVLEYFRTTTGLPWIGTPYQFGNDQHASAVLVRINPSRIPNSDLFIATLTYEEPDGGGGGGEPDKVAIDLTRKPPLQWHDQISLTTTYMSIPIRSAGFRGYYRGSDLFHEDPSINNPWLNTTTGYRGPVVNSARDPYDPEPEGEIPIDILRITRNVWPWDDAKAKLYRNTVNDADVTISKPEYGFERIIDKTCGRIVDLTGDFEVDLEFKQKYWRVTIEVHINPLGWRLTMIDKGLRRRAKSGDTTETGVTITSSTESTTGPALTHIKDAAGNPITTPVLFDGNGKPIVGGTPNPVLMRWEHYTEITWDGVPW